MYHDASYLAAELSEVARRLRAAADGGLTRELGDAITAATATLPEQIRRGLPGHMPARYAGVLGPELGLGLTRRLRTTQAGVTLRGYNRTAKRRRLRRLEGGVLAHPVFGDRKRWFNQMDGVVPGFFSGPAQRAAPQVRAAIEDAMYRVAAKLAGR